MKAHANHTIARLLSVAFLAFMAVTPAAASGKKNGGEKNGKSPAPAEKQVTVKYAGYTGNSVVFKVNCESPKTQKLVLMIKNAEGEVLYREQIIGNRFTKTVHLLKEASEMCPTFVFYVGKEKVEQSFVINLDTREDVSVARL